MMFSDDLSTITGWEGYDEDCSVSEFKERLKVDLSYESWNSQHVFWKQLGGAYKEADNIFTSPLYEAINPSVYEEIDKRPPEILKVKIIRVLKEMASQNKGGIGKYLVQFWAPEVDKQQHIYLTSADQPFSVRYPCKGLCWYRQHCMSYRYRVDKGAQEEELGAVGRVFRNKHLESSPDLRLYSTNECPLRDYAAGCGLRSYLALPVFDLRKENCYGVIEVLSICDFYWSTFCLQGQLAVLQGGLKAVDLRTTHLNLEDNLTRVRLFSDARSEIREMLELSSREVPQLQMAQVWVPCRECSSKSNNLSCMEKAISSLYPNRINDYDGACEFHNLEIGKHTTMISAVMSSNNKACICRNICDFSISENPLAHYSQQDRLSFCFAICLESLQNSRDFYVVEFFMQCTSVSAFVGSFLPLLLRIMEMKLKNFNFAYKGRHGKELVVEVLKENMLSSGESSQTNALRYESVKYKHPRPKEFSMPVEMKGYKKMHQLSDVTKYLQNADLHCLIQPSGKRRHGWVFWSQARQKLQENEVNTYSSLPPDPIQEKINNLISKITSKTNWDSYALVQFWAPKVDVDRCYLETSTQPFAFSSLHKGLAYFRKQCMEHKYYVDDGATEEELGPPGRVFRNRHREIPLDLRLYSPTKFPLRNHAAHCGLRKYFALPVFNSDEPKCVGVLELVGISRYSESAIKDALKAANLTSTHIDFKPSFLGSHLPGNDTERRRVALSEIQDACKVFAQIPQLHTVEVWVPYNECPSINNNLSCMECVLPTYAEWGLDSMRQIRHVETGKGIAGIALASENKSCFCRDLCGFGIADRPLAHYAQQFRLNVCFAICLQSCHTGDLLYLLEFYLNQGPSEYKYVRSFLCFLIQIMKQKLQSFKVASGQQLGERLVVEVIEFSEVNELAISELDQPDSFPIAFKFVKYGGQKLSKDKEVLFAADCMESVTSTAQTEHCNTLATNLRKKDAAKKSKGGSTNTRQKDSEDKQVHFPFDADMDSRQENAPNKTEGRKRKTGHLNVTLQHLEPYFGQKLKDVVKQLGVSRSTIKRTCRDNGIQRWPSNENYKKNPSFYMGESAEESAQDSQQNMCPSPFSNLPPSDMPLQNAPHTNPESSQGLIVQPKDDMVVIKATYEGDTVKFQLHNSGGMEKLAEEVAMRHNLEMGSFKLKYLDEDNDKILLACDADLQFCLKSLVAVGKTFIQVFVQLV